MMLYLGEDNNRDEYAVQDALIENNLFIGNGELGTGFAAPIGLRGVHTFTGAFRNGKSWGFLAWGITEPDLLPSEHLYIAITLGSQTRTSRPS